MPLPARLLFLLLFGVVLAEGLPATPHANAIANATAEGPSGRTVVHSWDKLRITVKSGAGLRHGRLGPSDPGTVGTVLIKAPRRFVPKPNSPTCPDGTDADHKGNCRAYW